MTHTDFELIDEEDPEVFYFDEIFVKTLHKLGIQAQKFLDTWSETTDEWNKEKLRELLKKWGNEYQSNNYLITWA